MLENKIFEGIHYSRFVASWVKVNGRIVREEFKAWLGTLTINGKEIPDDIIHEIYKFGVEGKMELEASARNFRNIIIEEP